MIKMNHFKILITILLFSGHSAWAVDSTPHLWWGHEILTLDVDKCMLKSKISLLENGFKEISKDKEYNFFYASKDVVRVGVQCVKLEKNTFLYVSVAGNDVKKVEKIRNEIIFKIR